MTHLFITFTLSFLFHPIFMEIPSLKKSFLFLLMNFLERLLSLRLHTIPSHYFILTIPPIYSSNSRQGLISFVKLIFYLYCNCGSQTPTQSGSQRKQKGNGVSFIPRH